MGMLNLYRNQGDILFMTKWFNVGKIVNTHGVKGEIRVVSRTDFPEERYKVGNTLYISNEKGGEPFPVKITSHRQHKTFDLLTFEGYGNVNEVEQFKGSLLKVPEDQLGELAEGEYYYHEIIRLQRCNGRRRSVRDNKRSFISWCK